MTKYNTGNPVGSSSPLDLYDNAENLDAGINGPAATWRDRRGQTRKSWAGVESDFGQFLADGSTIEFPTWAAAAAAAGAGQVPMNRQVVVIGDEGTHVDPVSGLTVSNSGRFVMVAAGLQWRSADVLTQKLDRSEFAHTWQASDSRALALSSWTGYGWGVRGANGRFPIALRLDGTSELAAIETPLINGLGLRALSPWSGYVWAIGGDSGVYPLALDRSGRTHISELVVGSINGRPADASPSAEIRYPGATQEWWIGPVHTSLSQPYGRIASGAYGQGGEIYACEFVPGLGMTKQVLVGSTPVIDDHNAPALWMRDGRRGVMIWTEHNETDILEVRITTRDADLSSLARAPAIRLGMGQATSYAQIFRVEHESSDEADVLLVLTRLASLHWAVVRLSVRQDTGAVTQLGVPVLLFQGASYYISAAMDHSSGSQVLRIAGGYNPAAAQNAVHYWELDLVSGILTTTEDSTAGNIISGVGLPVIVSGSTPVLPNTIPGQFRRLFYVRPGPIGPAIAYAEWDAGDHDNAIYKVAVKSADGWSIREHGKSGRRFGHNTSSNYIAGISFPNPCHEDIVLIARQDHDGVDHVEEYAEGTTTILKSERGSRFVRPIVPEGGYPLVTYGVIDSYATSGFFFTGHINSVRRS